MSPLSDEMLANARAINRREAAERQRRQTQAKPAPGAAAPGAADEATAETESGDILLTDVEGFLGRFCVHPSEHAIPRLPAGMLSPT